MLTLWVDRYRPSTLQEYVWVDPEMRATVEEWLAQGALPHCLFSGFQGTGKTSLAQLLFNHLNIPDADILYINASRDRNIDSFQERIMSFVGAWAMGPSGVKYVLLDEADKMSPQAQGLLRSEMETKVDICRFVMTANYPQKIIPALHSRLQELRFPSLNREDFTYRLADILAAEKVDCEPEILLSYVAATYPDLRKCINLAQQNARGGTLAVLRKNEVITKDYLLTVTELFRKGQFIEARKRIIAQIQPEEYEEFYRFLYQNLPLFGVTQDQQDSALLIIRQALLNHAVIADAEINASACIVELAHIATQNI